MTFETENRMRIITTRDQSHLIMMGFCVVVTHKCTHGVAVSYALVICNHDPLPPPPPPPVQGEAELAMKMSVLRSSAEEINRILQNGFLHSVHRAFGSGLLEEKSKYPLFYGT